MIRGGSLPQISPESPIRRLGHVGFRWPFGGVLAMLRRIHNSANPDPGDPERIQVQSVNEIATHLGVNPDSIDKRIAVKKMSAHKVVVSENS
jgi:hypothetical protein